MKNPPYLIGRGRLLVKNPPHLFLCSSDTDEKSSVSCPRPTTTGGKSSITGFRPRGRRSHMSSALAVRRMLFERSDTSQARNRATLAFSPPTLPLPPGGSPS